MANSTRKEGSRSGFPLPILHFHPTIPCSFAIRSTSSVVRDVISTTTETGYLFFSILSATEVSVLVLVSSTVIRFAFASSHLNDTISNTSLSLFLKYPALSCIKIQE